MSFQYSNTFINKAMRFSSSPGLHAMPRFCTTQAALQLIRNTQHRLLKVDNLAFFEKKS